jgi:hypothetical protein
MEKADVLASVRNAELVVPAEAMLTNNVFVDRPPAPGRDSLYVYIVVMMPESSEKLAGYNDLSDTDTDHAVGAWVRLSWDAPSDVSLVDFYRVYRAAAASSADLNTTAYPGLSYEMIQDRVRYDTWTDQVPQSIAHDVVYRIVPVSLWGVEGQPVFTSVHIPATLPPAEPECWCRIRGPARWRSVLRRFPAPQVIRSTARRCPRSTRRNCTACREMPAFWG